MAGIAESCTHVGAVLRGTKTVTDVPAYWMMPANVEKVQAEVGYKIDFTSGAAKRVALDKCISGERGMSGIRTCSVPVSFCSHEPTLSDLSPLLQIMHAQTRAVCLSGMEDYYHHYIDPVKPHVVPKSLQHLRDPGKDECNLHDQHCNTLTHLDSGNRDTGSCSGSSEKTAASITCLVHNKSRKNNSFQYFCDFVVWTAKDCYGSGLSRYKILENTSKEGTGLLPQGFTT